MKSICVFCEGKTEKNYLQSLNRFLDRNDIYELRFTGKDLEGVNVNNYNSCIRKYKGHELKGFDEFYAWIDFDIFQRGNRNQEEIESRIQSIAFNKKKVAPLFNTMNGEDFMMLHQSDDILQQWIEICKTNKHFEVPMHRDKYMEYMKNVIPDYKKGVLRQLEEEDIKRCIENEQNQAIPFCSGAVVFLEMVMESIVRNGDEL